MKLAVVGAGVIGLSVTNELIKRGHEVRCYEAVSPMSARSSGDTRIFRHLHRSRELIEYAMRARELWDEWERRENMTLVGRQGLLASMDNLDELAAGMQSAGAQVEIVGSDDRLTSLTTQYELGPLLMDPAAGVINAARTGQLLLRDVAPAVVNARVTHIEVDGINATVRTSNESWECDSVLIAAGAGTAELAAQVGVEIRHETHNHARFTFRLKDSTAEPPCLFDDRETWRPGFTTYGQSTAPGSWAFGVGFPREETLATARSAEAFAHWAREIARDYVEDVFDGVVPEVIDEISCNYDLALYTKTQDGFNVRRSGPVLVFWGENLFKFVPALAKDLADSVIDFSLPDLPLVAPI